MKFEVEENLPVVEISSTILGVQLRIHHRGIGET
jgi:hypothetical protein